MFCPPFESRLNLARLLHKEGMRKFLKPLLISSVFLSAFQVHALSCSALLDQKVDSAQESQQEAQAPETTPSSDQIETDFSEYSLSDLEQALNNKQLPIEGLNYLVNFYKSTNRYDLASAVYARKVLQFQVVEEDFKNLVLTARTHAWSIDPNVNDPSSRNNALLAAQFYVKNYPESSFAHKVLAELYLETGRLEKALDSFEAVILFSPEDQRNVISNAFIQKSKIFIELNQVGSAIAELERALTYLPGHSRIYVHLARAYYKSYNHDRALENARLAVEHNKKSYRAHVEKILMLLRTYQFNLASIAATEALDIIQTPYKRRYLEKLLNTARNKRDVALEEDELPVYRSPAPPSYYRD